MNNIENKEPTNEELLYWLYANLDEIIDMS